MSTLRLALLLLLALLAGCGGGSSQNATPVSPPDVALGGAVSGLGTRTLILQNGSAETLLIRSDGNFSFAKKVPAGSNYAVSIWGNSGGLSCSLKNGAGKADPGGVSNINVACGTGALALVPFFVGVKVSGLAPGKSVTFTNNGTDTLTATDNGLFVFLYYYFKEGLSSGQAGGYKVAVQTNPSGQTCSLSNASGASSLGDPSDFVDVVAVCK